MPSSSSFVTVISRCTIYPNQKSTIKSLKLSVSDLPMLSCHYIQKGVLLNSPPYSINDLLNSLKQSLSVALGHFPALAGRFETDSDGYVHIVCNDAGAVDFIHAKAKHLTVDSVLPPNSNVPHYCFKEFFTFDQAISYSGHTKPLAAVQVTELADGVFIGCTVNHSVTDGTSFWHFFNTFAEINGGVKKISKSPDFSRDTVFYSSAVLQVPEGGPKVTFSGNEPLRERIFHFSRESILELKFRANNIARNGFSEPSEIIGKESNDSWKTVPRGNGLLHQESTSVGSGNIDLSKSTAVHAAYSFIITLLVSLVGLKFLGSGTNPFIAHPWTMWLFMTTAFAYFIVLLAEITIAGGAPTTSNLFCYVYLISGAVACELLGFVLVGPFGLLLMNPSVFLPIMLLRRINQQITTTTP